jgi:uncharacterized phage protein (TIGR02218 family)
MKTVSSNMRTHLDQTTTTLATCWYIRRTDGTEFFFTDHDRDIVFSGDTYLAAVGYSPSSIDNNSSLGVDNLNVQGFIDSATITAEDLIAGLFNYAEYRIFMVNYENPDGDGQIKLKRGRLGEVQYTTDNMFNVELRSLTQALAQSVVNQYGPDCPVDLGDIKCGVPIDPAVRANSTAYTAGQFVKVATGVGAGYEAYENRIYECTTAGTTAGAAPTFDETVGNTTTDGTVVWTAREAFQRHAVVASVTSRRIFAITVTEARAVDNWFDLGVLTWETGDNTGRSCEIKTWADAGGVLTLYLSLPYPVQVGDRLRLYPGCNKSAHMTTGHCANKFVIPNSILLPATRGNIWNFRGFNKIPGISIIAQTPRSQG